MIKKIYYILFLLLLIPLTSAYTIIHYENFNNYSCVSSDCQDYGWYNLTSGGAGLTGLRVDNSTANMTYSTSTRGVARSLNNVGTNYCINPCGIVGCNETSNITLRFNVKQTDTDNLDFDDQIQFGIGEGTAYMPTNHGLYKLNGSVTPDSLSYFQYSHDGGVLVTVKNMTPDNSFHTVQFDIYTTPSITAGHGKIYMANMSVDGISNYATISFPIDFTCLEKIWFRFRTDGGEDFVIDNLYVLQYSAFESFINPSENITFLNDTTVQCNDTIDNDGDTLIDFDDPQCTYIGDNDESPFDEIECNNSVDDDGDGLIDYPQDPACSSLNDTTESPQNLIYQCNDFIDNDLDGFIDMQDPSCTEANGTTELPAQASQQEEDVCSLAQLCVLKETFPYTDSIYLHNWLDLFANNYADISTLQGGKSLLLINNINSVINNFALIKQFTNSMDLLANEFEARLHTTFLKNQSCSLLSGNCDNNFYVIFDGINQTSIILKYVINLTDNTLTLYNINSTNDSELISVTKFEAFNIPYTFFDLQFNIHLDLVSSNYSYTILGKTFPFYQNVIPQRIRITDSGTSYDSSVLLTYFDVIEIKGLPNTNICTKFAPPYYLKEDFINLRLKNCGWYVSPEDIYAQTYLNVVNSQQYLSFYKGFIDTTTNTNIILSNRYSTLSFQFFVDSNSVSTNVFSVSLWDAHNNQFLIFNFDKNGNLYDGNFELITNFITNTWHTFKLVTDLTNDNYDLYIDNIIVKNNGLWVDENIDVTEIGFIFFQSALSQYKLDNIKVFISDINGNPFAMPISIPSVTENNTILFGTIFKNGEISCITDSDCPSGLCGVISKKCSPFNYKLCDQNGYNRTTWCFIKLWVKGSLKWFAELILDNFLYFIGFLIIIMIIIYIRKIWKGG